MERDDLLLLIKQLSEGFLSGDIKAALYARTVEGLISSNLDTVPDLEAYHLKLGDFGVRGAGEAMTEAALRALAQELVEIGAGADD